LKRDTLVVYFKQVSYSNYAIRNKRNESCENSSTTVVLACLALIKFYQLMIILIILMINRHLKTCHDMTTVTKWPPYNDRCSNDEKAHIGSDDQINKTNMSP